MHTKPVKLLSSVGGALLSLLTAPYLTQAADIYIAQTALGANTGGDPANAHSAAWLNTAANWIPGTGRISPGDTIHLCGTITNTLTAQASGTAGSPITLLFEPNARLSSPAFSTYGAINLNQRSYLTVDGGVNGIIENTANGSALPLRQKSVGIFAAACNYTTIRNLTIRNLYVHSERTDSTDLDPPDGAIYCGNQNYLTISNCTMSDVHWCINYQFGGASTGLLISSNHMYNTDHGIAIGVTDRISSNIVITGNYIHDYANWDTDSNRYHHDGIHIYALTRGKVPDLVIDGNKFGGDLGVNNTAHIYLEAETTDSVISNALVCNNILLQTTVPHACFGAITVGGGGLFNGRLANNTIFGVNVNGFNAITLSGGTPTLLNNVVSGAWAGISFYRATPGARLDYNIWANLGGNGIGLGYRTISSWQTYLGAPNELHSTVVTNALLNSNGLPLTNSPAIGFGTNLSTSFTTDYLGKARPASGPWDAGAYQYGTSTPVTLPTVSGITQSGSDVNPTQPGLQVFAGSVVQYSGSASDPGGRPISWQWLYVTNGGPETLVRAGTGVVESVSFNYSGTSAGNLFTWKLRVNNGLATAETNLIVGVEAPPLAVDGLTFTSGSGTISAPFVYANEVISQSVQTVDPAAGGRAAYSFSITYPGDYIIQALVNAPNSAANSFYLNIDAEPETPTMIWDIPTTLSQEQRVVSWRGTGSDANNQFVPKVFPLTQGVHQLILRGREANVQLRSFVILQLPPPPRNLRVIPQP